MSTLSHRHMRSNHQLRGWATCPVVDSRYQIQYHPGMNSGFGKRPSHPSIFIHDLGVEIVVRGVVRSHLLHLNPGGTRLGEPAFRLRNWCIINIGEEA